VGADADLVVFDPEAGFVVDPPELHQRNPVSPYAGPWEDTRLWVIARPLTGFAETFSQYIVEHVIEPGRFAYLPPDSAWTLRNRAEESASFHWIRKAYQRVAGLDAPEPVFAQEREIQPVAMPDADGDWATTRFVDPADLRHDMHVTIVTLRPGAPIPFAETHVIEHGLYVLQGKAVYLLNQDWVEVEAGDFMRLRAFV
jgi:(S)-ureidoglycine aminohydrolase